MIAKFASVPKDHSHSPQFQVIQSTDALLTVTISINRRDEIEMDAWILSNLAIIEARGGDDGINGFSSSFCTIASNMVAVGLTIGGILGHKPNRDPFAWCIFVVN